MCVCVCVCVRVRACMCPPAAQPERGACSAQRALSENWGALLSVTVIEVAGASHDEQCSVSTSLPSASLHIEKAASFQRSAAGLRPGIQAPLRGCSEAWTKRRLRFCTGSDKLPATMCLVVRPPCCCLMVLTILSQQQRCLSPRS